MALIKCVECKKKISEGADICPNCGNKLTKEDRIIGFQLLKKEEKRGKNIFISLIFGIILVLFFVMLLLYCNKKNTAQEETVYNEQKNKEEQKEKKEDDIKNRAEEYLKNIEVVYSEENDIYNLMCSVWYNAICEIDDKKTDRYTKKKGKFVGMDNALENFMCSTYASNKIKTITENVEEANKKTEKTRNLYKEDKDVEEVYLQLKEVAESISKYKTKVNNPFGLNYETYLSQCTEIETEYKESVNKLKSLIQQ